MTNRTGVVLLAISLCLTGLGPVPVQANEFNMAGGPLRVRNMSPVVQLYGLPRMVGARVLDEGLETSFNFEAVNNFQSDNVGGTFVFFDGETYISSLRLRGAFANRWEWGFEVPWVVHAPGSLDGVVDEFHELFGLPDGERSLASRYRLDYLIRSDGNVYADFDKSLRTLGDVRGFVGYEWFDDRRGALSFRTQVKLPTGKVADLSGSEGTDIATWAEYEYAVPFHRRALRFSLGGGLAYLGQGELIAHAQKSWSHFGHLGVQFTIHPQIEFHAQVDAHSAILNTGNPLIADGGVLGTLGGRIGLLNGSWFDLAIVEDLSNESASDVIFQVLFGVEF